MPEMLDHPPSRMMTPVCVAYASGWN